MTFRSVHVPGGELSVEVLPGDTAPVLAIHGVSSNCRLTRRGAAAVGAALRES